MNAFGWLLAVLALLGLAMLVLRCGGHFGRRPVLLLADAMVPALPRFAGVMSDLAVQQALDELPLGEIRAPTLIVGSRHDGDIGYANAVNAHDRIAGSTLITVEQFGHFIWWGDASVTRDFEVRIEAFLADHVRP